MKNKFTKEIDRAFRVLGTQESKFLILGHCYRDHDAEWGEVGDMLVGEEDAGQFNEYGWECCPIDIPDYGTDGYKKADEVFEELVQMINKSYPELLEPEYSGTNEYWTRYYFITRDYKLKSACTMSYNLDEGFDGDGLILDFSTIPEDAANKAEETSAISQIKSLVGEIEGLISRVRSVAGKETIADLLSDLLEKNR